MKFEKVINKETFHIMPWLKRTVAVILIMTMMCNVFAISVYAYTNQNNIAADGAAASIQSKGREAYSLVMRTKHKYWIKAVNTKGKVKWSTSNKKVLKILTKSNEQCTVMPLKNGEAVIAAKAKNITVKYKIVIRSGKKFLNAWCRQWVKDNIKKDMDFKEKLIRASAYVVSGNYEYGDTTSEPEDVITKGEGNCASGGRLVASLCKAMGYEAKVRFAAKDDMSRYPAEIIFMKKHFNVEVKVKGRKYYIDGTPNHKMVYLCDENKTLYYGYAIGDKIYPPDSFLDLPPEMFL